MAKVSATARLNFRTALSDADIVLFPQADLGDGKIDKVIKGLRSSLSSSNPRSQGEEIDTMVEARRPLYDLCLQVMTESEEWDADEWSALLWDLYAAAVSNIASARKCESVTSDQEAWADMITLLLASPVQERSVVSNRWLSRWAVVIYFLIGSFVIGYVALYWQLSGKSKVGGMAASLVMVIFAELWRRCGFDLLTAQKKEVENLKAAQVLKKPIEIALSTASSQLRKENEALKAQLQSIKPFKSSNSENDGPRPRGAPPLPAPPLPPRLEKSKVEPSVLVQSMQVLSAKHTHGPMLLGASADLSAEPQMIEVGTLARALLFFSSSLKSFSSTRVQKRAPSEGT